MWFVVTVKDIAVFTLYIGNGTVAQIASYFVFISSWFKSIVAIRAVVQCTNYVQAHIAFCIKALLFVPPSKNNALGQTS